MISQLKCINEDCGHKRALICGTVTLFFLVYCTFMVTVKKSEKTVCNITNI